MYAVLLYLKDVGFGFHVFGPPASIHVHVYTHHHRKSCSVNYVDDAYVPPLLSLDGCLQLSG